MRIAWYNVENLFSRLSVLNITKQSDRKIVLNDVLKLNNLIENEIYSDSIKDEILSIVSKYSGILTGSDPFIQLNELRGKLITKPREGSPFIKANGRESWVGNFEYKRDVVPETAVQNTGIIIKNNDADIIGFAEVENRSTLIKFNRNHLDSMYKHAMLIDGNDERGIDVGILSKEGYQIESVTPHVDDEDSKGLIFSRDCPVYKIKTPTDKCLFIILNHFKSKIAGGDEKRNRQSKRVAEIVESLKNDGATYIVVMGDLNDTPDSNSLSPLIHANLGLTDLFLLPQFDNVLDPSERGGTHGNCTKSGKIDYMLISEALRDKVQFASIDRSGIWAGKNGDLFPHISEIKGEQDSASDHAYIFIDFDL